MKKLLMLALALTISYGASAQRKTEIVETTVNTVKDDGMVLKRKVAIGRFSNETQYATDIATIQGYKRWWYMESWSAEH